jgi:uncharacterized membrane protein YphA (DoxX/SURF4 family)
VVHRGIASGGRLVAADSKRFSGEIDMPGAGLEPARPKAAGFKPAVYHQFHHPGGAKSMPVTRPARAQAMHAPRRPCSFAWHVGRPASVNRMDERERVLLTLAGVRVFMGVFWLVNLLWRLPTDFGDGGHWGLRRILEQARDHGISPPVRSLVPHVTVVGWLVFAVELLTGLLLVFGLVTRLGAALGLLQAIVLTLFLGNAPGEWLYGYLMLVLLSALLLALPVSRRLSIDDGLGRDP